MTITLYIDFDGQNIYTSEKEARKDFDDSIGFLDDYDPLPFEEWLEDNYTVIDVWKSNKDLLLEEYNKYAEEKFNEWFNECIQEVTIEV